MAGLLPRRPARAAGHGRAAILAALLLGVPGPGLPAAAAAGARFAPPAGCTLEVTVQSRGCSVAQHYRCAADRPGDQWVVYFDADGPVSRSRIDAETRWMESTDIASGLVERLEERAADHASLSTLLAQGADDFDFWTRASDGARLHHVGRDELTGETAVIDGVPLEKTRFRLTTSDEGGDVLLQRQGQQFVSRSQRRFYGGIETLTDWTGNTEQHNDSPVNFAFPGEAGFAATTPEYDCDLQMVGPPGAPAPQPPAHDKEART